jgi:hypothetical protein
MSLGALKEIPSAALTVSAEPGRLKRRLPIRLSANGVAESPGGQREVI